MKSNLIKQLLYVIHIIKFVVTSTLKNMNVALFVILNIYFWLALKLLRGLLQYNNLKML